MGNTFSSVQSTSILPFGHPVPPATTFTILNAGGGVDRFCGRAEATATTAATESTNFILEYLVSEKFVSVCVCKQSVLRIPTDASPPLYTPPPVQNHHPPKSRLPFRLAQSTRTKSISNPHTTGRPSAARPGVRPPQAQLPSQAPPSAAPLRPSTPQPRNLPRRSRSY